MPTGIFHSDLSKLKVISYSYRPKRPKIFL